MKGLREKAGLTQEAVAYKLDVSYSTVRNWENGRTIPTFTPEQAIKALSVYDCSLKDLDIAVRETQEQRVGKKNDSERDGSLTAGGAK